MSTPPSTHLYYCQECSHVYYTIPPAGKCMVCGNLMTEDSELIENDLLKCETCHSVYLPTARDEIIPNPSFNEKYLCACKNNCPTKSVLRVSQDKGFVGNIILANPYRCTNCKAFYFRGFEERHKECSVCGSRNLTPVEYNSENQLIFWKCANPKHGIRLKYADIIMHINKTALKALGPIRQKEEQLKIQYQTKDTEIRGRPDGFLKRDVPKKNADLQQLVEWAAQQRFLLYDIKPIPAKCAVYKKQGGSSADFDKVEGCDAIVEANIRKVVDTDTKSTQIKRKAPTPQAPTPNVSPVFKTSESAPKQPVSPPAEVIAPTPVLVEKIPEKPSPEIPIQQSPIISTSSVAATTPTTPPSVELAKKESVTPTSPEIPTETTYRPSISILNQVVTNPAFDGTIIPVMPQDPFNGITPDADMLVIKMEIDTLAFDKANNQTKWSPLNYGIFPIKLDKNGTRFRFGREIVTRSLWLNQDSALKWPFILNNITPLNAKNSQFEMIIQNGGLFIAPGMNAINTVKVKMKTGDNASDGVILTQPIAINDIESLSIKGDYALDKEKFDTPHKLNFKISFQIPANISQLLGGS